MRSGAAKKLEHKHIDLEAQVIRLPIELSKNKKGLNDTVERSSAVIG
jgi:hypothetical protein